MRRFATILVAVFAVSGFGYALAALAASQDTGTVSVCATATLPAHTIGVDSRGVYTISGTTTQKCATKTYTIPAPSTTTVTVTGTPTSTTSSTTSAPPPPASACSTDPPGASLAANGQTYQRQGWDTFTKDAPTGTFATSDPSTVVYTGDHGLQWTEYPDGWPSTNSNGAVGYEPSTVLSVHNGMLDFSLHTDAQGHPVGANPSPKPAGSQYQTYGAWSMCERIAPSDAHNLDDFKQAVLLWPQSDSNGPAAESDFPEGNLNGNGMGANAHFGSGGQDSYQTGTLDLSKWHVYTQTWGPGYRSYFVDGKLIGTSKSSVWSQPERWQLQVEPLAFNDGAAGHVDIGWVWIGGAPDAGGTTTTTSTTTTTTPTTSTTTPTTSTTTSTTTSSPPPPGKITHVVVIAMENQDYGTIYPTQPFETTFANSGGLATNYYGTGHFSLDNYITMTSGVTGVGNDDSCVSIANDNIFNQLGAPQLDSAGLVVGGGSVNYEESGGACRHNPAGQYSDLGSSFEQPLPDTFTATTFAPKYVFISPSTADDGHDTSAAFGDNWLKQEVPKIENTPQYKSGSMALFIVYDEATTNDVQGSTTPPDNHVFLAVQAQGMTAVKTGTQFTHCSLLRTTEALLGVPALGCAASAPSMVSALNLG